MMYSVGLSWLCMVFVLISTCFWSFEAPSLVALLNRKSPPHQSANAHEQLSWHNDVASAMVVIWNLRHPLISSRRAQATNEETSSGLIKAENRRAPHCNLPGRKNWKEPPLFRFICQTRNSSKNNFGLFCPQIVIGRKMNHKLDNFSSKAQPYLALWP